MPRHCPYTSMVCAMDCGGSCHKLDVIKAREMREAVALVPLLHPDEKLQALQAIVAALTRIESLMARKPTPIKKGYTLKDGKIVKIDTAPPHVRAGRRRKAGKVTGVRAIRTRGEDQT